MVFSFFKKDPKEKVAKSRAAPARAGGDAGANAGRAATPPLPKPIGKPLSAPVNRSLDAMSLPTSRFATTDNALPERDIARTLAMQTAAKIDAIESEMTRDFLRPNGGNASDNRTFRDSAANSVMQPKTGGAAEAAAPTLMARTAAEVAAEIEEFEAQSDSYLGSVDAIEIGNPSAASIIDETAILFANRQDEAAEAGLRAAIDADQLGAATETAWLMLFELIRQRGDKAAFEKLTMQYALRFENSAPAWFDYQADAPKPDARAIGGPVVRLPAVIDASIVKPLEQLKTLAMAHASLTLDVSSSRSIDLIGAELLLRVLTAFKRSSHEFILLGAETLVTPLRAVIEPGRRDVSDAAWMLLLEIERLLGRQEEFEETGIQYCITFEVSPPSWEPAPPNLKSRAATGTGAATAPPADPLEWRGEVAGEGEPHFSRLAATAKVSANLSVDCAQLRRMGFAAGSALLGQLIKIQQSGARIEFRHVNYLVGALLQLLGVTAVAHIQLRRN